MKESLKLADLKVTFVPVASADRIDAVAKSKVDIECGATTMTLSREEKVDFTLMTFVTGGSLLSNTSSGINALADLSGKSVAVVAGTATAVSNRVSRRQANRWAAQEQQQYYQQAPPPQQYYEPAPPPPPPAPAPAAASSTDDLVTQLKELAALRDQGILTDAEFNAQKAKLLGS